MTALEAADIAFPEWLSLLAVALGRLRMEELIESEVERRRGWRVADQLHFSETRRRTGR